MPIQSQRKSAGRLVWHGLVTVRICISYGQSPDQGGVSERIPPLCRGIGVGYVWFDNEDKDLDDEYSYFAILGFDQVVTEWFSLFVEVEYMWLEPDYNNAPGDADLDGFGVSASINFNF